VKEENQGVVPDSFARKENRKRGEKPREIPCSMAEHGRWVGSAIPYPGYRIGVSYIYIYSTA